MLRVAVLFFISMLFVAPTYAQQIITSDVAWVTDGDTLVLVQGKQRVRLRGIDAPEVAHKTGERDQAYGRQSKALLERLVEGQRITLRVYDTDRYGRWIATVYRQGRNVNLAMVSAGLAWQWTRYSDSQRMAREQQSAQAAQRGLWADAEPVAPWLWRHNDMARATGAAPTAKPSTWEPGSGNAALSVAKEILRDLIHDMENDGR